MSEKTSYDHLMDWLNKHNARCFDQIKNISQHSWLEIWTMNGRVLIVQVFIHQGKPNGWEIYTACPDTNLITDAFKDAEVRLKVS